MGEGEPTNLEQLLDRLATAGNGDDETVSLGSLIEVVGRRSFAPLLLFSGLIVLSPLSGIPGMPTLVAVLVLTVSVQLLFNRKHFWLPDWILKRKLQREKLNKGLKWLRTPARFIDRLLRRRLTVLTHDVGVHAIAVLCVLIAAAMPPMELVPFAASIAGGALTALGLSLIAHDGLLSLIALIFTAAAAAVIVQAVL